MPIAAAAIIGAATLIAAGINAYSQYRTNHSNQSAQESANATNLAFAKEQFDYQKTLNANQYQIAAADMAKAGINPAMASGVNLTTGSYSSNQSAQNQVAPQVDLSPISSLASTVLSNESQQKIAAGNNATSKEVADANNKTSENIANIQAEAQKSIAKDRIDAEKEIANNQIKFEQERASFDSSVKREELRRDFESYLGKSIQNQNDLYELYKKMKLGATDKDHPIVRASKEALLGILRLKHGVVRDSIGDLSFEEFAEAYADYMSGSLGSEAYKYSWEK